MGNISKAQTQNLKINTHDFDLERDLLFEALSDLERERDRPLELLLSDPERLLLADLRRYERERLLFLDLDLDLDLERDLQRRHDARRLTCANTLNCCR